MKNILKSFALAASMAALLAPAAQAIDLREHRAIYVTPYLGDWPTSAITQYNADQHKQILRNNLDAFKKQNINVLYYHVRSMCDATYRSAYEPWSKGVGGTRGTEPAFDPLEYLIEQAHERGIEIYAWVNPYRYEGVYTHDYTPLNYAVTHPDWLIVQSGKESILNPALEEVQQRICDVVSDIITKYDVDGIIFDDYFYSNPTPNDLDKDLYDAAYAADPSVGTQIQWRANNVNTMVGRVSRTIKEVRPWVVFGISPAGIASPSHITSQYGLQPYDGDWQYSAIASDPINWYYNHYVDFMAPQIYWPSKFDSLEDWWNIAARKYQRHLYSAVTLSDYSTYKAEEYDREVEYARSVVADNQSGIGFFSFGTYVNSYVRIDGKLSKFGEYLAINSFREPALTPLRPWNNVYNPEMVSNITRDGSTLTWDAAEAGRYTVYAFAPGEEQAPHSSNLLQVAYKNSVTIPDDMADYTFGVCVYDRYGNEYSMLTEGATVSDATAAELTYPADGEKAADLFDFTWNAPKGSESVLEVATDADFTDVALMASTMENSMSSYSVPNMQEGQTYYWRVRTTGVNVPATVSPTQSFVASRISITGPTSSQESTMPTITWTPAFPGSTYFVEISRNSSFTTTDFQGASEEPSIQVPDGALVSGYNYYVRVTATRDDRSSTSDVARFGTADVKYDAPKFARPLTEGATLHCNEAIEIEPWMGMNSVTVQISASESFPARTSYKTTLRNSATETPELSEIKVSSKVLEDGQTYYVRVCGNYFLQSSGTTEQHTDYTTTSFVYSSEAGVGSVIADDAVCTLDADGLLTMPCIGHNVAVYAPSGMLIYQVKGAPEHLSLAQLASGIYIVKVDGPTTATFKWVKK